MQEINVTKVSPLAKASWSSVLGGVITILAISVLLSALGLGTAGDSILSDSAGNLNLIPAHGLWYVIALSATFMLGGFIAGKLAGANGAIHGFLVWASALICAVLLGSFSISSTISAATHVIRQALSENATVRVITVSSLDKGPEQILRIADDLNLGMDFNFDTGYSPVARQMLKATDIPVMQPEFIQSQMENARNDAARSLQMLRRYPDDYLTILSDLIARLDQRISAITEDIDQESAIRGLMKNAGMSEEEAQVNLIRLLAEHQQAANLARDVLGEAEGRLRAAQLEIDDILESAHDVAASLSRTLTRSAMTAFFTLLLGAILCSYAGYLGTIWRLSWHRKDKVIISKDDLS